MTMKSSNIYLRSKEDNTIKVQAEVVRCIGRGRVVNHDKITILQLPFKLRQAGQLVMGEVVALGLLDFELLGGIPDTN